MKPIHASGVVLLASLVWSASPAVAQPLGVYRWQLQPYCNVLSLAVTQQGGQYQLDGTDDQCGASQAAAVRGLAFQNLNGSIGFGLTIVTAPGARPVHVDATILIATLSGSWTDSAGNSGGFIFTPGAGVPGAPRPVPSGGLAPGSVTTVQLSPTIFAGTGSASTVARSDHNHDDRYFTRPEAETRLTRVTYNGTTTISTANSNAVQIRIIGNFTKTYADTKIRLTWLSHVTASGAGHCNFQLRVDGLGSVPVGALGLNGTETIIEVGSARTPAGLVDVYEGLSAGSHQISLWLRNAATCEDNPGNYTRTVLVEEFR